MSTLVWCLLAGALCCTIFWLGYRPIDDSLYANRDDGIITVSHARNWVEYGTIGVNPSGERVEGYSSPLQLVIFSGVYALTGLHYSVYFQAVTAVSAFVLGMLLFLLCMPHRVLGLVATGCAAFALTRDFSFFEWHASGMENALTHAFFLITVVALIHMYASHRIHVAFALPVLAATFARIESIYHIAPLLVLFAIFWLIGNRQLRGLGFALFVLLLWGACFALRWHYFGALFPNTAAAQGISIGDRLAMLVAGDGDYLRRSMALVERLFRWHHGLLLLPIALCLPFFRYNRNTVFAALLCLSLAGTGLFSPFLFGAARLDVTRLSTQVAVALVTLALLVTVHTRRPHFRYVTIPVMILGIAGALYWTQVKWEHKPYYLWFSEDVFAEYRDMLVKLREEYDIPRPTLANPDLGLMSWHKDFNIVDLGYLGSPVLTRLDAGPRATKQDIANYVLDIAAPDLIEMHGVWSERHAHLFKDPRFHENYMPVNAHVDAFLQKRLNRSTVFRAEYGNYVRAGYWVRRAVMAGSNTQERQLIDDLRTAPTLDRLEGELERCAGAGLSSRDAWYVPRTAYRFLPEFVAAGAYDELLVLFERYQPVLGYSTALLRARRDPDWHEAMYRDVLAYGPAEIRGRMASGVAAFRAAPDRTDTDLEIAPGLRLSGWRLTPDAKGWGRLEIVLSCTAPIPQDWRVFVHGEVPKEKRNALSRDVQRYGFLNWDFGSPTPPTRQWHEFEQVILTQYVPHADQVTAITVGLYRDGEGTLGGPVRIPIPAGTAD